MFLIVSPISSFWTLHSSGGQSHGGSRRSDNFDPSKSRLTTSSSSSSHSYTRSSSSAEHADASRLWLPTTTGQSEQRSKFQAEPRPSQTPSVADETLRLAGQAPHQSGGTYQQSHSNHTVSSRQVDESTRYEEPKRLDDQSAGSQRIVGDPREEDASRSTSHHHQSQQVRCRGVSGSLESLPLGPRVDDDSTRSQRRTSNRDDSSVYLQTTPRISHPDSLHANFSFVPNVSGETEDDVSHVPTEQRRVEEQNPPRSDGSSRVQHGARRDFPSEKTEAMVSALQHTLTSTFLSPFTDNLGLSLRKINDRLRSMSSLYESIQHDVTKVKQEISDGKAEFQVSLSPLLSTVSLLHENMSRIDEKHKKNLKKNK